MAAQIKKTLVDARYFASEHARPNFHELKMRRHTRLLISRSHLVLLARILLLSRQNANGRPVFLFARCCVDGTMRPCSSDWREWGSSARVCLAPRNVRSMEM